MNRPISRKNSHKKSKISGFRRFLRNSKSRTILKMRRKKGRKRL